MNKARGSATERARRIWWSDAARRGREAMREAGAIPGDWIDDIAAQRRGHNVADQLGRMTDELAAAGVPDTTIRALMVETVLGIVAARQDHGPRAA